MLASPSLQSDGESPRVKPTEREGKNVDSAPCELLIARFPIDKLSDSSEALEDSGPLVIVSPRSSEGKVSSSMLGDASSTVPDSHPDSRSGVELALKVD